ncbi:hypothetical protein [Burkholderia ubonensis]|uniref:hypothetical protein n=1 Tax=Burkholderia ubonensis TaxID=101571 RepID=UPI001E370D83|nr:hypothetical protein [Burkholderia ubonensis]
MNDAGYLSRRSGIEAIDRFDSFVRDRSKCKSAHPGSTDGEGEPYENTESHSCARRFASQMRDEGISVLLVEQNARMVLKISEYAYVLDDGGIVHSGSSRELAADENRVRALTGVSTRE